jgi:hypothetical protein
MRNILLINQSTVISASELAAAATAFQIQVKLHFAPLWAIDPNSLRVWYANQPYAGYDWLFLLDNTDQANALGYHTVLSGGQVGGFVFAKTDQAAGVPWTVTLSHEGLEMLANPYVDLMAYGSYLGNAALRPLEVGDPTESATYKINGLDFSNFVTPNWFHSGAPGPYDYLRRIGAPLQLDSGGYMSIATTLGQWTEVFGEKLAPGTGKEARAGAYSRLRRPQTSKPPVGNFGSVDSNLSYIIKLLGKQAALITDQTAAISQQTQTLNQQSQAIAAIAASISDPNNDPQTLVDLASKLKGSNDPLAQSVAASQPK